MLHTLMHSPFEINMVLLIGILKSFDDLVMFQDGVILSLKNNIFLDRLFSCSVVLHVLELDLCARGIKNKVSAHINLIDYHEFVLLTEKHKNQMFW